MKEIGKSGHRFIEVSDRRSICALDVHVLSARHANDPVLRSSDGLGFRWADVPITGSPDLATVPLPN